MLNLQEFLSQKQESNRRNVFEFILDRLAEFELKSVKAGILFYKDPITEQDEIMPKNKLKTMIKKDIEKSLSVSLNNSAFDYAFNRTIDKSIAHWMKQTEKIAMEELMGTGKEVGVLISAPESKPTDSLVPNFGIDLRVKTNQKKYFSQTFQS
jgi:hypothetical protein